MTPVAAGKNCRKTLETTTYETAGHLRSSGRKQHWRLLYIKVVSEAEARRMDPSKRISSVPTNWFTIRTVPLINSMLNSIEPTQAEETRHCSRCLRYWNRLWFMDSCKELQRNSSLLRKYKSPLGLFCFSITKA